MQGLGATVVIATAPDGAWSLSGEERVQAAVRLPMYWA
jgi:hypothetical protein